MTATVNERRIRFNPLGRAIDLFNSRDPELVIAGPAGTGKSRACLEKLHAVAWKYPGARLLMTRRYRSWLTQTAMVTFEQEVLDPAEGVRFHTPSQEYRYPNGSVIVVAGLDEPKRVMSTEYDLAYPQECTEIEKQAWEQLTTRLRHGVVPYQQILGDCNPDGPRHWLKLRADTGRVRMLESRHEDNPKYWDATNNCPTAIGAPYLAKLDALTGVRYQRLRLGQWASAEGMVYEEWDRSRNLVDVDDLIALGWLHPDGRIRHELIRRFIAGVDWGYTNPGVIQIWGLDGDGRMVLLHETYRTGETIDWWIAEAQALAQHYPIERFICDPSAPAYIAQFVSAGLPAIAGDNAIGPGIQVVRQRIRPGDDGRVRLMALRTALVDPDPELVAAKKPCGFIEEIEGYIWDRSRLASLRELPVKIEDHSCDAARYVCAYLDLGPKPGSFAESEARRGRFRIPTF